MYSSSIFVAFPAVALVLMTCATHSVASPALVIRERHHPAVQNKTTAAHAIPRRIRTKHVVSQAFRRAADDPASLDALLNDLTLGQGQVLSASNAFSSSAQKDDSDPNDTSRQDTTTKLTRFQESLTSLYPLLSKTGNDKGLANYDKSDQLETLLKNIVNANKDVVSATSKFIDSDPLLGGLLGPIVYQIKCILDELLDYTENVTDASLNWLAPLLGLQSPIQSASGIVCRSTFVPPVAGFCIGL